MALEALSSSELLNFMVYDTISATPCTCNDSSEASFLLENSLKPQEFGGALGSLSPMKRRSRSIEPEIIERGQNLVVQGRKKRRRRLKICKNGEEAEKQRMTHIAVERNRRKQMNEHLAVLRSLMPESYVQRGDQASIVGGAIQFVKELEHLLQSLEAQKFIILQQGGRGSSETTAAAAAAAAATTKVLPMPTPFAQFFTYPQYTCSQIPGTFTSKNKATVADIEVTLIETHASIRILSRVRLRQLSKMVTGFQTFYLTILHLNVITLDPMVLYSISATMEEGCQLNSADDIAGAVHQILRIIEEEASLC